MDQLREIHWRGANYLSWVSCTLAFPNQLLSGFVDQGVSQVGSLKNWFTADSIAQCTQGTDLLASACPILTSFLLLLPTPANSSSHLSFTVFVPLVLGSPNSVLAALSQLRFPRQWSSPSVASTLTLEPELGLRY